MKPSAVILFSGGMDSTTVLAIAKDSGFNPYTLSISYGQRHSAELDASSRLAEKLNVVEHRVVQVDMNQWGGSALTSAAIDVPLNQTPSPAARIPVTYVPARNTIMLSLALSWAEVLKAQDIFIGVNAVDYSGYPDCRPEYIKAFETMANLATKAGVEGHSYTIHAPLQYLSKSEIIQKGHALGIDFHDTVSCYNANEQGLACKQCDACRLRAAGFAEAGLHDETRYI